MQLSPLMYSSKSIHPQAVKATGPVPGPRSLLSFLLFWTCSSSVQRLPERGSRLSKVEEKRLRAQSQTLGPGEGAVRARRETQNPELEGSKTSKPGKIWASSLPSLPPCIPKPPGPRGASSPLLGRERANTLLPVVSALLILSPGSSQRAASKPKVCFDQSLLHNFSHFL